jgi:hypothetical protein
MRQHRAGMQQIFGSPRKGLHTGPYARPDYFAID